MPATIKWLEWTNGPEYTINEAVTTEVRATVNFGVYVISVKSTEPGNYHLLGPNGAQAVLPDLDLAKLVGQRLYEATIKANLVIYADADADAD